SERLLTNGFAAAISEEVEHEGWRMPRKSIEVHSKRTKLFGKTVGTRFSTIRARPLSIRARPLSIRARPLSIRARVCFDGPFRSRRDDNSIRGAPSQPFVLVVFVCSTPRLKHQTEGRKKSRLHRHEQVASKLETMQ